MRTGTGVAADLFDIELTSWDGQKMRMDHFRGQVMLVVNVASRCGFTPQYAGLEALYRKYQDRGFVVLGFPCNQFGAQEPADERGIHQFCEEQFQVTFPIFSKIDVNGPHAHPLFVWLKAHKAGLLGSASIKWNFTKFLVDRSGQVASRFGSRTTPAAIDAHVAALLS